MAQNDPYAQFAAPVAAPRTLKERQAEASISSSEASTTSSKVSAARTAALTPADVKKANIDAQIAELTLDEARAKAAERERTRGLVDQAKEATRRKLLNVIANAAEAKRISQGGLFASGFGAGTTGQIGGTPASEIASKVSTIRANSAFKEIQELEKAGIRLTPISNVDIELLGQTIADVDPTKGTPRGFQNRMDTVISDFGRAYLELGGNPADINKQYEIVAGQSLPQGLLPKGFVTELQAREPKGEAAPPQVGEVQAEPVTELKAGAGEKYVAEQDKRAAAELQQLYDSGASRDALLTAAKELGVEVTPQDVDTLIQYRETQGRGGRFAPTERDRPLGEQLLGAVAESPVGAYAIEAGSALTGGLTDELVGLVGGEEAAKEARFAREFSQTESPVASLLGGITGGAMASVPALAGVRALAPGLTATRAALTSEAALGAVTGAGEADDDSRLLGAVQGGTIGAVAGAVPGAMGRVLSPRTPEAVAAMRKAGVDMSVGQTLGVPGAEASLAGVLPGGGDITLRAQRKAFEGFQDAYINDALGNLGIKLPEGLKPTKRFEVAQKAFDDAYEAARAQMQVVPDAGMRNDILSFRQRLAGDEFSADTAKRLDKLLQDQLQLRIQGPLSGDGYKSLSSLLGKRRAAFAKQGNAEMADGVAELQRIVDANARRHSPPEAVELMDRADRGYGLLTRAEEAARNLGNAPGEFTPQQAVAAARKGDISARNRAFVRGDARGQELAEQGVEALGSAPPADVSRIERGLGFSGSVLGAPLTIPANIAMGVANAPGIRPMLNTAIAGQRPQAARDLAELIRNNPQYAAAPAGGMARTSLADRPEDINELRRRYEYGGAEQLPNVREVAPNVPLLPGEKYDPATNEIITVSGERIPAPVAKAHGGRIRR